LQPERTCEECGKPIPADARQDFCPACSFGLARQAGMVSGGDGSSLETAVRLNPVSTPDPYLSTLIGIHREHAWIRNHFAGARVLGERLHPTPDGIFEVFTLRLPSGQQPEVSFEITPSVQSPELAEGFSIEALDADFRHWLSKLFTLVALAALIPWETNATASEDAVVSGSTPPPRLRSSQVGRVHGLLVPDPGQGSHAKQTSAN
jgi:hypothetical protein